MNYEIQTNRVGQERVVEKVSPTKIRVTGESLMTVVNNNGSGIKMFDFENGPHLNVGGTFDFLKTKWKIKKIMQEDCDRENLASVLLEVDLTY